VNGETAPPAVATRPAARPPQQLVFASLTITGNNRRGFYSHWHAGGMKLIPQVRGIAVRDCTVADNAGPGIWFDASLGGNAVEDNIVVRNRVGIVYEISGPAPDDAQGILIRNNRVALSEHQGIFVSASRGAVVERNTLFRNRWDIVLHGMPRDGATLKRNRVTHNILFGSAADQIVYVGDGASDNIVDANVYARGGGQVRFGAVTGRGYDARYNDLRSLRADWPAFESTGESRGVPWRDAEKLDFRIDTADGLKDAGWQPVP
jgi:hypothetical protein